MVQRLRLHAFYIWGAGLIPGWGTSIPHAKRCSQNIFKKIYVNLEYSLEGLMLKLKLQYFGHMMKKKKKKTDLFEKTRMLGKIEGRKGGDKG